MRASSAWSPTSWCSSASTAIRRCRPTWSNAQHQGRPGQAEQQAGLRHLRADLGAELALDAGVHQLTRTTPPRQARASRRSAEVISGMDIVEKINSEARREAEPGRDSVAGQCVPEEGVPEAGLRQEGDDREVEKQEGRKAGGSEGCKGKAGSAEGGKAFLLFGLGPRALCPSRLLALKDPPCPRRPRAPAHHSTRRLPR